ncbi:MAG TPA: TraC family protein [Candidatus Saccharimonadales bacterium]
MFLLQKSKSKTDARTQIDIEGVRDQVLVLPGNSYRAILHVSSVNFELKSEDEQDILIDTFESFLNSVGCPLQILIRTREIDMDKYLDELSERLGSETEDIYRSQLQNYDEFIRSLIMSNRILTRSFYVVIPYDPDTKMEFELVKEQLNLRVDIVSKGLARLGMHSRELTSLEILDLFYSFYSPIQAKLQPLTDQAIHLIHSSFVKKEVPHE